MFRLPQHPLEQNTSSTIAPIPSIVKSSAPNVLANVFAYFHALTLQLASFEKFASSFTPPSFKFSENFNSLLFYSLRFS